MAKYFLTNKAVEDLSKIYEYTYGFWSEYQADKYYEELIAFCQKISENPRIGKFYEEIDLQIFGFIANKHIIFYRILTDDTVEITRILSGNMDLKSRIKE